MTAPSPAQELEMTPKMPRRDFLGDCSRAVGGAVGAAALAAPAVKAAPADRVNVAVMGIRGRGRGLALGFSGMTDARVAYLCDVDERLLGLLSREVASRQASEPRPVGDVRRALEDP